MITEYIKKHLIHIFHSIVVAFIAMLPPGVMLVDGSAIVAQQNIETLFVVYFGYLVVILLVYTKLIYLWRNNRIKKRNEYLKLHFQLIQKQLDSHFTFNVLNSISAAILRNERKEAHKQVSVFSKVLRYIFDDKKSLLHPLNKEIELTENYLILEKYRFKEKFDYKINIEGQINEFTKVPKQIIQLFVDNAIRHGLMPVDKGGFLLVNINNEDEDIHISIEDNGVGRVRASRENTLETRGYSIKLVYRIINFLNKDDKKNQLKLKIFDLYKNGDSSGTRVEIWVPSGYDPKIG